MKKIIAVTGILSTLISPAYAGSLYVPVENSPEIISPAPQTADWSGFYIGGSIGFEDVAHTEYLRETGFPDLQFTYNIGGISGGGFAGYNLQFGAMIVGVEGSYYRTSVRHIIPAPFNSLHFKYNSFADIKARVGISSGNRLLYGFVGSSTADFFLPETPILVAPGTWISVPHSFTPVGLNFGAGVSYKFDNKLFVGAELLVRELLNPLEIMDCCGQDFSIETTILEINVRVGYQF